MKIKLDLTPGPVTVEVAEGITLTFLPFTSTLMLDAQAAVARRLGLDPDADGTAEEATSGARRVMLVAEAATLAITAWSGFTDGEDKPIEPTPEAVAMAVDQVPAVYAAINAQYIVPGILKVQEGNG